MEGIKLREGYQENYDQENYDHNIPNNKKYKNPRINLTFRLFSDERYSEKY